MDTETNNSSSAIIGSQFCAPNPVQLNFANKVPGVKRKSLAATDIYGKIIFKTESPTLSPKHRSVLIDAASGNPLVSIQKKLMDPHGRWQVFMGNSFDPKDLLFTVERTSMLQIKTKLNVFLATNTTKEVCDFRIEGSYHKKSCKVYKGNYSTIVAQMIKERNMADMRLRKNDFAVSIHPNTDLAFIVALIIIRRGFHIEAKMRLLTLAFSGGSSVALTALNLALIRML